MKKAMLWKVLIGLLVAGIIVFAVYEKIDRRQEKERRSALEEERNELWDNIGGLEKKVADLEEELAQQKEPAVPGDRLRDALGEEGEASIAQEEKVSCDRLQRQMGAFFSYLDRKGYVAAGGFQGGSLELVRQLVTELAERPPMVTEEMQDLYSLTQNLAYFYRILGKARTEIIRDLLESEVEIMEPVMATFFSWVTAGTSCETPMGKAPELEALYEYAAFFLKTLGGRSYLMRRSSRIRTLASYYSVLTLNLAEEKVLNRHGIDIRPHIIALISDMTDQKGLMYKTHYLRKLNTLRHKYGMQ